MVNRRGLTLVELIVSTAVASFVVYGMFNVIQGLNVSSDAYGKAVYAEGTTQATMNHILNNAKLMVGSVNNIPFVRNGNTFCLGQEGGNVDAAPDSWQCYTQINNNGTNANQIFTCTKTTVNNNPSCNTSDTYLSSAVANCIATTGSVCVETVDVDPNKNINPTYDTTTNKFTIIIKDTVDGKTYTASGYAVPQGVSIN